MQPRESSHLSASLRSGKHALHLASPPRLARLASSCPPPSSAIATVLFTLFALTPSSINPQTSAPLFVFPNPVYDTTSVPTPSPRKPHELRRATQPVTKARDWTPAPLSDNAPRRILTCRNQRPCSRRPTLPRTSRQAQSVARGEAVRPAEQVAEMEAATPGRAAERAWHTGLRIVVRRELTSRTYLHSRGPEPHSYRAA